MKLVTLAALSLTAFVLHAQPVIQERTQSRRLALLIGNQNYAKLGAIPAVSQDVDLIAKSLRKAGFQVSTLADLTNDAFPKAADEFTSSVRAGDICFVYYSGLGAQDRDNEDDFLIPTDFDPAASQLTPDTAYPVTLLAKKIAGRNPAFQMFFIEGARRPPKPVAGMSPDAAGLRLPYIADLKEVMFAIPTSAGRFIDTPPDQVGLFTKALAHAIDSEKSLPEVMPQILAEVSGQRETQQPKNDNKVTVPFFFHEPVRTGVPQQNSRDREFYVLIPAGKFLMGCVPGSKCEPDELPQHEVTITNPFWIGQNEVEVDAYRRFIAAEKKAHHKRSMPKAYYPNKDWRLGGNHPINNMRWEDARDYCSWAGGRLPTEAEWEYAARGGRSNEIYFVDPTDPEKAAEGANFAGQRGNDQYPTTAPVKKFNVNGFGLYDMAGNVWELVADYFGRYSAEPQVDPKGPDGGKWRVKRGGSFDADPKVHLRISYREPAKVAWPNVGFRCALNDNKQTKEILRTQ